MNQEQVLDLFRRTNAMLEGHFRLSSGRHSNRYFQCALLLADPRKAGSSRAPSRRTSRSPTSSSAPRWVRWCGRTRSRARSGCARTSPNASTRSSRCVAASRSSPASACWSSRTCSPPAAAAAVFEVVRSYGAIPVGVASIVNRSGLANPFEQDGVPFARASRKSTRSRGCRRNARCARPAPTVPRSSPAAVRASSNRAERCAR